MNYRVLKIELTTIKEAPVRLMIEVEVRDDINITSHKEIIEDVNFISTLLGDPVALKVAAENAAAIGLKTLSLKYAEKEVTTRIETSGVVIDNGAVEAIDPASTSIVIGKGK